MDTARAGFTLLRRAQRAKQNRAHLMLRQKRRLSRLLRHAALHSSFYRDRWGGAVPDTHDFAKLPPVTKSDLRDTPLEELATCRGDKDAFPRKAGASTPGDQYTAVATSGSTGEPALMVYSNREWSYGATLLLSILRRGVPRGLLGMLKGHRVATVATTNPAHVSTQLISRANLCGFPSCSVSASGPIADQIEALAHFRPSILFGYPSALRALAQEHAPSLAPRIVFTSGETLTHTVRDDIREAWHVECFDLYGLTETMIIAGECTAHDGLHVAEDAVLIEVVDEHGAPVPDGQQGSRILVTNLFGLSLPIIRYEVSDAMAISREPCACGETSARIVDILGRQEDRLELQTDAGTTIAISSMLLESPIETLDGIRQFRFEGRGGQLVVHILTHETSEPERASLARAAETALAALLAQHGVGTTRIQVCFVDDPRDAFGPTDKRRR